MKAMLIFLFWFQLLLIGFNGYRIVTLHHWINFILIAINVFGMWSCWDTLKRMNKHEQQINKIRKELDHGSNEQP